MPAKSNATRSRADASTRLNLAIAPARQAVDCVAAALLRSDIAAVVLRPRAGEQIDARQAHDIVTALQGMGVAALVADDARLARTIGADGVALSAGDDILARYEEARGILGSRAIVGADAGTSRHDAMELGEAGADYIAFGLHAAESEQDGGAAALRQEFVGWWAEIFEPPVVAEDVRSAQEVALLAAAGADFVCVAVPPGMAAADIAPWLLPIAQALEGEIAHA